MIYPIITAEEAAEFVKNGDNVGVSGFTAPGCPKAVAPCIAAKARREMIEGLKKAVKNGLPEDAQKDGEEKVQKLHDKFLKKIDEVFAAKEKEILTV